MLSKTREFFNNLSFGQKLIGGASIVMLLMVLEAVVGGATDKLRADATDKVNTDRAEKDLVAQIQVETLQARQQEKDFLLQYVIEGYDPAYNSYIVPYQAHLQKASELMAQVRPSFEESGEQDTAQLANQLDQALTNYQSAFMEVITSDIPARIDQKNQLLGDLSELLDQLDRATAGTGNYEVNAMADEVVTTAQSYLEEQKAEYIDAFHNQLAAVETAIQFITELTPTEKNNLLTLTGNSLTSFDALVEGSKEIAAETATFSAAAGQVGPLVEQLVAHENAQVRETQADADRIQRLSRIFLYVATILAVGGGTGLAVVITRQMLGQVREIDELFRSVAVGEFGVRARVFSHDELGRTAEGVNAMLEQLYNHLTESETAALERVRMMALLGWAWEVDAQGRYTYCSESVADILGYSVEEMLGKTPFDFMLPEEVERIAPIFGEIVADKRPIVDLENWNRRKDGSTVCLLTNGVPVLNSEGDLVGYRGADKDITERKQAEAERERLLGEMARQAAILDNINDFVGIADLQGRMVYANPAGLKMTGHTREDIRSLTTLDLVAPEEHPRFMEELLPTALERGIWAGEALLIHTDGTHIPVEGALVCIKDKMGQPQGVGAIARNITERKQAEVEREQLLSEMARQAAILDNINDFAAISTMEGQILYINPSGLELLGYTPADIPGLTILNIPPSDEIQRVTEEILPAVAKEGLWIGETAMIARDGTRIPVQAVLVLLRDKAGQPEGLGAIVRDIREQKRIVANVEDAATQVTDASASMAQLVQVMADQATHSVEMAEKAAIGAQQGDRVVGEAIEAMDRIRDHTQETARRIKHLGEASQEISEVVRLIEELSDRTTVLALNASIQAAAAGEAGRGFAVVAEEVQRLAERATGATREIEKLVKSIQAETSEVVVGVEEATREVVSGSQLAQQAGERMAELNALVGNLTTLIQQASETTAQQTSVSVETLNDLLQGLQVSVAAFGSPDDGAGRGNGHGELAKAVPTEKRGKQKTV
jgi:PAS domain S-box-containing protein